MSISDMCAILDVIMNSALVIIAFIALIIDLVDRHGK
jgi:hypothetical protein